MFKIFSFQKMQYLIHYPGDFNSNAEKEYPVIFYFHGSGSRGTNHYMIQRNDYFTITGKYEDFPFITVAPQCHEDSWFDLWERVKELVEEITSYDFCDRKRVYAMGASMGGYAVWQLGMSLPQYFAAIVPICGGGMYWNAHRLKNVPVWAFHGRKDDLVKVEESIKMVDAVNENGGSAKLTIYEDCGHEAWLNTYANPEVFAWLLEHTK